MKSDRPSPSPISPTSETLGCWTAFFLSGFAPILACFVLHGVYGVEVSSGVWLLSGAADLIVSVSCLPVFWLALGISPMIFKARKEDGKERTVKGVALSLILYLGVVILVWALAMDGIRVLKAN